MKDYIGIDISKATIDVYDGKKSYKFSNDEEGFNTIVSLVDDINNAVFIFEPTGVYSYALTQFCALHSIAVVIVPPKVSKDFAKSLNVRSKTDKIDAQILYKYQKHIEPNMIKIPQFNDKAIELQEMLNSYEEILDATKRLKNQLESISNDNTLLRTTINNSIDYLLDQANTLFEKIEQILLKDEETKERYNALITIPSIGKKSAIYLIIFFQKYNGANAKEITALVGLDPVYRESGKYKGKQKISKHGGERLRVLLFLPTLCATQHNDRIKAFYTRLLSNAKAKKLAVGAAMRKLILLAFSIYNSKQSYRALEVEYAN